MHYDGFRKLVVVIAASGLLGLACGDDKGSGSGGDTTGGDTTGGTTMSSSTIGMTGQMSTGNVDTTAGSPSTSMDDASFLDGTTDGGPTPQPNGAQCQSNTDCESEFCFTIPMVGGVCSECLADTDCDMGTCSLDPTALYAICTDGSIGVMCDSDEGCMDGLVCAQLIDTGGLFPLDFCSNCSATSPCEGTQICSPVYDVMNIQGYMDCVDPGSVPNDQGCPLVGAVGDGTVCESGFCGTAQLLGLIPIGVCGECLTDMDCPGMSTCQPGSADMSGLVGATCL